MSGLTASPIILIYILSYKRLVDISVYATIVIVLKQRKPVRIKFTDPLIMSFTALFRQQAHKFTLPHLLYCVCTTISIAINKCHKCFNNMLNCGEAPMKTAQTCVVLLSPISIHPSTHTHTPTRDLIYLHTRSYYTNQNTGKYTDTHTHTLNKTPTWKNTASYLR